MLLLFFNATHTTRKTSALGQLLKTIPDSMDSNTLLRIPFLLCRRNRSTPACQINVVHLL